MKKNVRNLVIGDVIVVGNDVCKVTELSPHKYGVALYGQTFNLNRDRWSKAGYINSFEKTDDIDVYASRKEATAQILAYYESMKRPLPFFVYGTLRPGYGNYFSYFEGRTIAELPGKINGIMYESGIPFVIEGDGIVKGDLLYVKPEAYGRVLQGVDRLEGFNIDRDWNNYTRKEVTVTLEDGSTTEQAWCYIMEDKRHVRRMQRVESGDFHDVRELWR